MPAVNLKTRVAPLLLAAIVGLGVASVPVGAAAAATPSTQAATKTGTLAVQLVDAKGKVLKKRVMIAWSALNVSDAGTTSAKGARTVTKLAPGSSYAVSSVSAGTYVNATKTRIKITAGKTTKVTLKLVRAATISGTVKSTAGKVLAGVQVSAMKGGHAVTTATTSSKGTYTLTVKTGSYKVAFNTRVDDLGSDRFNTTYWRNATTLEKSATVKATQQTSKKSASASKSVNGSLTLATTQTLSGTVDIAGAQTLQIYSLDADSNRYTANLTAGEFSIDLPLGRYLLGVVVPDATYGSVEYYFVGDDAPASTDVEQAIPVELSGGAPVVVAVNAPAPAGK